MSTGYDRIRATKHNEQVCDMVRTLRGRGYKSVMLECSGDGPDIRIEDRDGKAALIENKAASDKWINYAIKLDCLTFSLHCGMRYYYVFDGRTVLTPAQVSAMIVKGPLRPSGNGSNCDHVCVRIGNGVPFDYYFGEHKPDQKRGGQP